MSCVISWIYCVLSQWWFINLKLKVKYSCSLTLLQIRGVLVVWSKRFIALVIPQTAILYMSSLLKYSNLRTILFMDRRSTTLCLWTWCVICESTCWILLIPPDGEGGGGPDPLPVPQGEPGQRIHSATWRPPTEVRAAGLYEFVTCFAIVLCFCAHLVFIIAIIIMLSLLYYQRILGLSEAAEGDWHPFGVVLLFLPICSAWLISHDKGHGFD